MNGDYSRGKFQEAIQLAQQYGKRTYVEEFGGLGDVQMAQALNTIAAVAHQQGYPDRTAWAAFEHQAYWAQMSTSPFQWPEI